LLAGERRQAILRVGRATTRNDVFEGEGTTMADSDPNAPRKEETERLRTYQRDRDLQRRGVKIDDAIQGITDDDRKMLINKSLRKVNSALSVS
jgi:hypothetical protein